jgi:RNA polymerase sigma factor (TIGR02999 family)
MAAAHFRGERCDHTLQPTALVHEVFIRLVRHGPRSYRNRAHFFGIFSRAMRQLLIDQARNRLAQKRGGAWERVAFEDLSIPIPDATTCLAVDEALRRLEEVDPRLAQIVELRYYAELTSEETAELMQMGESTVRRELAIAKAWLRKELGAPSDF